MDTVLAGLYCNLQSSQEYLYSAFHNIDCIKAAPQYQSEDNDNVRFLVEKHPRPLVSELRMV